MEPRRQDYDRLDLTRQRKFRTIGRGKSESEVDEAAIALVELSVLVYDDIGTIGKTAAKLRDPRLGLFGKKGNRDADLQWLEAEREIGVVPLSSSASSEGSTGMVPYFSPEYVAL